MGKFLNSSAGQSAVEYIMLMALITLIVTSVLRSDVVARNLGENSALMNLLASRMEYSYRHGLQGEVDNSNPQGLRHDTYDRLGEGSRFFLPRETYPTEQD